MAARISFEETYFHAYSRLQRKPARLADLLVAACERDPAAPAPYLTSVPQGRDPRIRLVNVSEGYSVVVRVGGESEVIGLLWVGQQDKARRWATIWQPPQPPSAQPRRERAAPVVELPVCDDPLSTPLWMIGLPARMENWAEGAGIGTLGGLVRRHPADLAHEKRVGKVSIEETRALIQKLTGDTWESLAGGPRIEPRMLRSGSQPEETPEAAAWDLVRKALADSCGCAIRGSQVCGPSTCASASRRLSGMAAYRWRTSPPIDGGGKRRRTSMRSDTSWRICSEWLT